MKKIQLNARQTYIFLGVYLFLTLAIRFFIIEPQIHGHTWVSLYIGALFLVVLWPLYHYKIIRFTDPEEK